MTARLPPTTRKSHESARTIRPRCASAAAALPGMVMLLSGCPWPVDQDAPLPAAVLAACPGYPEENIRQSVLAVQQDRDIGVLREASFDRFELGCAATCDSIECVADCLDCGEAIYDVVYGAP